MTKIEDYIDKEHLVCPHCKESLGTPLVTSDVMQDNLYRCSECEKEFYYFFYRVNHYVASKEPLQNK